MAVLRPARTPSASRCCACAAPLVVEACGTPARFCTSFSLHDSAQQEPSAAPPALQELLYQSLQAALIAFESSASRLIAFESVLPSSSPSSSPSRAGCPSPAPRPGRARRRGPVACRLPTGLA